jgi:hypothetical protein
MRVSSAYCKPLRVKRSHKVSDIPFFAALISILENTSMTILNNRGERGSPYLRHFPGLKYWLVLSFILIEMDPLLPNL